MPFQHISQIVSATVANRNLLNCSIIFLFTLNLHVQPQLSDPLHLNILKASDLATQLAPGSSMPVAALHERSFEDVLIILFQRWGFFLYIKFSSFTKPIKYLYLYFLNQKYLLIAIQHDFANRNCRGWVTLVRLTSVGPTRLGPTQVWNVSEFRKNCPQRLGDGSPQQG